MFETSRRRFLLGLGAAGVLAATPVRLISGLPTGLPKLEVGDANGLFTDIRDLPRSFSGDLRARVVGPIQITNYAPHGYLSAFDGGGITFVQRQPEINITDLRFTSAEFRFHPLGPIDSYIDFRGWIKEEIWDKHINCELVKAYLKLPIRGCQEDRFICADFLIERITIDGSTL